MSIEYRTTLPTDDPDNLNEVIFEDKQVEVNHHLCGDRIYLTYEGLEQLLLEYKNYKAMKKVAKQ